MFPITNEKIDIELKTTSEIVNDWIIRIRDSFPIIDVNATEEEFAAFQKQFVGELRLAAGKLDNLADIIGGLR